MSVRLDDAWRCLDGATRTTIGTRLLDNRGLFHRMWEDVRRIILTRELPWIGFDGLMTRNAYVVGDLEDTILFLKRAHSNGQFDRQLAARKMLLDLGRQRNTLCFFGDNLPDIYVVYVGKYGSVDAGRYRYGNLWTETFPDLFMEVKKRFT